MGGLWEDVKGIWTRHGWHIILIGLCLILFVLFIFNQCMRKSHQSSITMNDIYDYFLGMIFKPRTAPPRKRLFDHHSPRTGSGGGRKSRGETQCKSFCEFYFQKPFGTSRPDFLKNPVTQENLELDVYNEELALAIEYNGEQHYHFNSFMHRDSRDRFQNQQYRDLIKKDLCAKKGICLIVVPYTVREEDIPAYLYEQFKQQGLDKLISNPPT